MDEISETKLPIFEEFRYLSNGGTWCIYKEQNKFYPTLDNNAGLNLVTNSTRLNRVREFYPTFVYYEGRLIRSLTIFNICNN